MDKTVNGLLIFLWLFLCLAGVSLLSTALIFTAQKHDVHYLDGLFGLGAWLFAWAINKVVGKI